MTIDIILEGSALWDFISVPGIRPADPVVQAQKESQIAFATSQTVAIVPKSGFDPLIVGFLHGQSVPSIPEKGWMILSQAYSPDAVLAVAWRRSGEGVTEVSMTWPQPGHTRGIVAELQPA